MKKQVTFKRILTLLLILYPFFSSAQNIGDFGSYLSSGPGAVTWNAGNCWATWNGGSWVASASWPNSASNVYILSGYTMMLDGQGYSDSLIVENGAQLYVNGSANNYVDVSGNITCNGIIGNTVTTTFDGIGFDIVSTTIISGSGTFSGSKIRGLPASGGTANLSINMNITLCYGTTSGSLVQNTAFYDHAPSPANPTTFNVTFGAGTTTDFIPYTGAGACNSNLSIAGSDGTKTTRTGTYTINGTVIVSGFTILGTAATAGYHSSWVINNGGLLQTDSVITNITGSGSGPGGSTLTINNGGTMQITGPTSYSTFFLTGNNTYNLNSGSTFIYSYAGRQGIDNGLTYGNLTLSGTNSKFAIGSPLNVAGNLTINSPDTLVLDTLVASPSLNVGGNWTDYNNAGFLEKSITTNVYSTVTFDGSSNQTISISTAVITGEIFQNVIINKSGGYLILDSTSNAKMTISSPSLLTLTSGIILADTSNSGKNYVVISNGASVAGASNSSFIYGRVERSGTTAFTYPVGKGSEYRPISIGATSSVIIWFAQYFNQDPDLGVPTPYATAQVNSPIDSVSRCEYWTLVPSNPTSATVTLSWDTYSCGVTNLGALLIARDSTTAANTGYWWNSLGNNDTTGTTAQGTITSGAISFNTKTYAYTLADTSFPVNPLPVSLLSFNAKEVQSNVLIDWTTASQVNNDYFTIEKTVDGDNFVSVGEVKGAGSTTSEMNYTFVDHAPFQGVSYYRLKQTDYNGNYTYSHLAPVNFTTQPTSMITLFPNPTPDRTYFNITWETMPQTQIKEKTYTLKVFDVSGREVMPEQVIHFSYGMLQTLDISKLPKGVYILQLNGDSDVQRTSLVKE